MKKLNIKKDFYKKYIVICTLVLFLGFLVANNINIVKTGYRHRFYCKKVECNLCMHINHFEKILKYLYKTNNEFSVLLIATYYVYIKVFKPLIFSKETLVSLKVRMDN